MTWNASVGNNRTISAGITCTGTTTGSWNCGSQTTDTESSFEFYIKSDTPTIVMFDSSWSSSTPNQGEGYYFQQGGNVERYGSNPGSTSATWSTSDLLKMEISATSITLYKNGTQVDTYSVSTSGATKLNCYLLGASSPTVYGEMELYGSPVTSDTVLLPPPYSEVVF